MGIDTVVKYAKLEPKSSTEAQLAMSKVHISKSWKLPPRSRPVKRQVTKQLESPTSDEEERKKRQNRDAQRAYRERRTNRIQELEDTVETLQGLVKNWQKKFRALESELKDVKNDNTELKRRLVTTPQEEHIPLVDPLLRDLIDNFKPMKAVTLKKRKLSPRKSTADCGFCSETTTCVCKEIEDSGMETARCTENTETCTKCSDIDQSCIKPRESQRPVETDTDFLAIDGEDQPNTMDPNFVPGSCKRCQSDSQSRAFCQAVYGPPNDDKVAACCGGNGECSNSADFIPISDAYQRIKKYMLDSDRDSPPIKHIASGLRARGGEVELKTIDDAIRGMDKKDVGSTE